MGTDTDHSAVRAQTMVPARMMVLPSTRARLDRRGTAMMTVSVGTSAVAASTERP
jgi:hypothetical protein